ncbi:adenylosuccinate lyase family protein [Streptomyces sp. NPDC050560]|uniref:adenylosuccinate lyase family protein n=1 Tax=Streptomyces sp. NPDC050560 TaxID=3365630 RepID=UPI0037B36204
MTVPADGRGTDGPRSDGFGGDGLGDEVRRLYARPARWQSWLDMEAVLARAQGELGLVPQDAVAAIAAAADVRRLDAERIERDTVRTGHALVPVVWELARVAGPDAGGWVHWGATSQNIMQTADLVVLRRVHGIVLRLTGRALAATAGLAERGADMPMAGRTHGQHAVPLTFGVKAAAWADELIRHTERLRAAEPRVFTVLFGGAVGTYAGLGEQGRRVQEVIARRLRMTSMPVASRSIADHLVEYVTLLGLLAGTVGKVADEIATLMGTEYGEAAEPFGSGSIGSSTMPQKRNPHLCQDVSAAAAVVRSCVAPALESMNMRHESDRGRSLVLIATVERAAIASCDMLRGLVRLTEGTVLFPERMRANLGLTGGLIMAEAVMMRIATAVGRQRAHEIVHEATLATGAGRGLFDVLSADPRVAALVSQADLARMLDPATYLGFSSTLAHETAARAREAVRALRAAGDGAGPGPEGPTPADPFLS